MSNNDLEHAIRLYKRGYSVRTSARASGIWNRRLSRVLKDLGIFRPSNQKIFKEDIDSIMRLYYDGVSINQIAKIYDVHKRTIHYHLDRNGVNRGDSGNEKV